MVANDYGESKRLLGRMQTALGKNTKAQEAWQSICGLPGRGSGKNERKRVFLFAWKDAAEKDGKPFGESFWEEVEEIIVSAALSLSRFEPWFWSHFRFLRTPTQSLKDA